MSYYEIVGASINGLTRYTVGEPSLTARVEVGIALNGDASLRINVGVPVDLTYDGKATLEQIEEKAFTEATRILQAIIVPDAATLLRLYREQFTALDQDSE